MTSTGNKDEAKSRRFARICVRLVAVLGVVYLAILGVDLLMAKIMLFENDAAARAMVGLIITVMVGYAILLAIPFIPGVEIGIAILLLEGASAAPMVYAATVAGMLLAFLVGQYAPLPRLISLCRDVSLHRAGDLLERIQITPRQDRLKVMEDRLPRWLAPVFCHYRYLTIGLAINMPGNIALGGGGGIMMAGGLSRLFQTQYMILTVLVATLPVPLSVWLLGADILQ